MGLFAAKAKLTMSIDEQPIVAGRPLTVRWSVDGVDQKVRSGRLELSYRNRYLYTSSDAHDNTAHETKRTVTVPVRTVELFVGEPPTGEQQTVVELPTTPASAPKGVEWHVGIVLDRPGRDVTAEQTITVLAPADGLEHWSSSPVTSSSAKCAIDVRLAQRAFRPGEVVRGTIDIRPNDAISARKVRVDLLRRRDERDGIVKREHTSVDVDSKVDLMTGQIRTYDFEIQVPVDAAPSFDAANNSQHWLVQAVVDRTMKVDLVGSAEVVVYNAP